MSMFRFFFKKILLIFLFNNFSTANNIDNAVFQDAGLSEKRLNKIEEIFIKATQNKEILGAVIVISRYGKIVYKKAFGMLDQKKQIPMTEDSNFIIYYNNATKI